MVRYLVMMVSFAIPILAQTAIQGANNKLQEAETRNDKAALVRYIDPSGLAVNPRFTQLVDIEGGRTILISGQAAYDKEGKVVGKGDIRAQSAQVFENLKIALAAVGASFNDVVKLTTFMVDMPTNLPGYRDIRAQYLANNQHPPASTTIGVAALVNSDLLLEVEAVAVVSAKNGKGSRVTRPSGDRVK